MKVGDRYEKDGVTYEVLAILGNNCWSSKEVDEKYPTVKAEDVPVLEAEIPEEKPVIVEKKPRGRRKKVE